MMKFAVLIALVGLAQAQAQSQYTGEAASYITRSENENSGDGNFNYAYETSNGITAQASGYIKNPGARSEDQIQVIQGSYSYYDPNGQLVTVTYIADENGFQPSNLPQAQSLPVRANRPVSTPVAIPTQRPYVQPVATQRPFAYQRPTQRPYQPYRPNNFGNRRY